MNFTITLFVIIFAILLGIAAAVGLFFLFRAITCWYLKINKMLREQQKTNAYLERIAMALERNACNPAQAPGMQQAPSQSPVAPVSPVVAPIPPVVAPVPPVASPEAPSINIEMAIEKKCQHCGTTLSDSSVFCPQCGATTTN
ncbi:MAG: zinc-ribbon domain-containing protein [Lachnospiraceae bacterium]|nr:zinc-ribbon domain-containing protein [Lachnospiraceae bacterium]